jgi:hypothetical protein
VLVGGAIWVAGVPGRLRRGVSDESDEDKGDGVPTAAGGERAGCYNLGLLRFAALFL